MKRPKDVAKQNVVSNLHYRVFVIFVGFASVDLVGVLVFVVFSFMSLFSPGSTGLTASYHWIRLPIKKAQPKDMYHINKRYQRYALGNAHLPRMLRVCFGIEPSDVWSIRMRRRL